MFVEKLEEDMISKLSGYAKQSGFTVLFVHRDSGKSSVGRSRLVAFSDFTSSPRRVKHSYKPSYDGAVRVGA